LSSRSAIIFDFDGTITKPLLAFDVIRAELGIDGGPILEAIANWSPADRRRAEIVLAEHERAAAESARLRDGAVETLAALRAEGHPLAILTRNARRWVLPVLGRFGIAIDAMRGREDGAIKPSPEPIHSLCAELGADAARSWMIGDHEFDIRSGKAAGARTVLIVDGREPLEGGTSPDHVIRRLAELRSIIGRR
jgi:HAD superfamily hydrolase (TIGR01509 family)